MYTSEQKFIVTYLICIFRNICNCTAKCPKAFWCKAFQMPQCPFSKLLSFCSKSEFLKIHPYICCCSKILLILKDPDVGILRLPSFWVLSIVWYSVPKHVSETWSNSVLKWKSVKAPTQMGLLQTDNLTHWTYSELN